MTLRDYQQAAVNACLAYEGMAPLIVCPTGSGKSHIIAELIKELCKGKDSKALIVSHRKEILEQNASKLLAAWPECPLGIYSASLKSKEFGQVTIAQVQSLARKLEVLPHQKVIIIDEAHLVPRDGEGNYRRLIASAREINPELRVIGLTATPYRLNSGYLHKGEDALFDGVAYDIEIKPLIDGGYLAPLTAKRSHIQADLDDCRTVAGEYNLGDMANAFDNDELVELAVKEICKYGKDRKSWLIFASSVAHAEHIESELQANGISSAIVTGDTMPMIRDKNLNEFKAGKIQALVNCDVLTTGFDAPNVDLIALLRATKSTSLYVQILGRGMRPSPGKSNCLVLDFGENLLRHGPIDNLTITSGREDGEAPYKVCPECESLMPIACATCLDCGYQFPIPEQEEKTYKHTTKAYLDGEFLASLEDNSPQLSTVLNTVYTRHTKKGGTDSLRATYLLAEGITVSEWVCLEHVGYAGTKASYWWTSRGGKYPAPRSIPEALSRLNELKEVKEIVTKKDGKWTKVVSAKLGERIAVAQQAVNFWEEL